MGAELIVLTRLPLPPHDGIWTIGIEGPDGGMEIKEHNDDRVGSWIRGELAGQLNFEPSAVVTIRKAWELSEVVAEALVDALGGILTDDSTLEIHYDAAAPERFSRSIAELEDRLRAAFANPEPYLTRRDRREQAGYDAGSTREDDWSDL